VFGTLPKFLNSRNCCFWIYVVVGIYVGNDVIYEEIFIFIYLFFFCGTGFELKTYTLHLEPLHQLFFCNFFFQARVSKTICPGWPQTTILLISAS
jgi:hypothetical protein